MKEEEISSLVTWEAWEVVYVRSKEEHMKVRTGIPQKTFWDVWKSQKDEIKALGIYVKKIEDNDEDGTASHWVVNQWKDCSEQEKNQAVQQWDNKQNTNETP